jgi:hypothetical protein
MQLPPTVFEFNSDMHNICAVAAGKADPERYASDHYLRNIDRFSKYIPSYVWMMGRLRSLVGGYSAAVWLLVLPTGLLFVTGMYLLLWRLGGNRGLAVGLTMVLAFSRIWFQLGEKWGMCEVWGMMPRTQYTALLPWLLLATWEARYRLTYWPAVAAFASVLTYVHPLSAPPWGLAVWCALVFGTGDRLPLRKRLKWGGIAALAAIVVAGPSLRDQLLPRLKGRPRPVAAQASSATAEASADRKQQELEQIRKQRYSPGLMDLRQGFADVWRDVRGKNPGKMPRFDHRGMAIWGTLWAIVGAVVGVRAGPQRRGLLVLAIMLVVFLVPTFGLSLGDSIRANAAGVRPTWYDLSRGIRFWPFWLMVIGTAGFGSLIVSLPDVSAWRRRIGWLVPVVAVPTACLAFWTPLKEGVGHFFVAEDERRAATQTALAEALDFISANTPPDAGFIVPRGFFWVRHTPGRPVCHSWKEGTTLSRRYAEATAWRDRQAQTTRFSRRDRDLLRRQQDVVNANLPREEANRQWQAIVGDRIRLWEEKVAAWTDWGAEYVLQPSWTRPPKPLSVDFENKHWFVERIAPVRAR